MASQRRNQTGPDLDPAGQQNITIHMTRRRTDFSDTAISTGPAMLPNGIVSSVILPSGQPPPRPSRPTQGQRNWRVGGGPNYATDVGVEAETKPRVARRPTQDADMILSRQNNGPNRFENGPSPTVGRRQGSDLAGHGGSRRTGSQDARVPSGSSSGSPPPPMPIRADTDNPEPLRLRDKRTPPPSLVPDTAGAQAQAQTQAQTQTRQVREKKVTETIDDGATSVVVWQRNREAGTANSLREDDGFGRELTRSKHARTPVALDGTSLSRKPPQALGSRSLEVRSRQSNEIWNEGWALEREKELLLRERELIFRERELIARERELLFREKDAFRSSQRPSPGSLRSGGRIPSRIPITPAPMIKRQADKDSDNDKDSGISSDVEFDSDDSGIWSNGEFDDVELPPTGKGIRPSNPNARPGIVNVDLADLAAEYGQDLDTYSKPQPPGTNAKNVLCMIQAELDRKGVDKRAGPSSRAREMERKARMERSTEKSFKRYQKIQYWKRAAQISVIELLGRRPPRYRALCIGVSYKGQEDVLEGTRTDAILMSKFLHARGYTSIKVIGDDIANGIWPSKENILQQMRWLVHNAEPGDHLFLTYSGHGTKIRDLDGDEASGYDQAVVPIDHNNNGCIIDDIMHDTMVKELKRGVKLVAIFDACHSGSILDLPFMWSTSGICKTAGKIQYLKNLGKKGGKTEREIKAEELSMEKQTEADVICISGCKDSESSADTKSGGKARFDGKKMSSMPMGALTQAFFTAVTQNGPTGTALQIFKSVRKFLADSQYSQKPQLSTGRMMSINRPLLN